VGYCIEHLVLTGNAFLPKWDAALTGAEPAEADAVFPYSWWRRKILEYAENPVRLKRKSPARLVPYSRYSMAETVERFSTMHKEFMRRVGESRAVNVRRARVQSPFFSWVWCPLGFSFDLALAHERRHVSQAWQVRRLVVDA